MVKSPRAVVLLSGGVDSATTLAIALEEGFQVHALTFRYGQRHEVEVEAASRTAAKFGVAEHATLTIDLRRFGGSALTGAPNVPKGRSLDEMSRGIPITYVPARNTIFLSYALAWAEVLGADDLFLGANAGDVSGYPDCRPEYIRAFEQMANLATKAWANGERRLRIHTPLINCTKAEIIRNGLSLGVDYGLTSSCYDPSPDARACGLCDACMLRLQGFRANESVDPIRYQLDGKVSA